MKPRHHVLPTGLVAALLSIAIAPAFALSDEPTKDLEPEAATEAPGDAPTDPPAPAPAMTQQVLEDLVRRVAGDVEGRPGAIRFTFGEVTIFCVSDPRFDRMRLIAPIIATDQLTPEHTRRMLEANFHSALDARYATSEGVLYAAFIHPLSPLTEPQLASAIRQVATLAATFGTHYSSGELRFGEERESL